MNTDERSQSEVIRQLEADAVEHCAHGIAIGLPSTNRILTCNPAFARLQGRTVEEIASMPILSMYAPQDHDLVKRSMTEADRTGSAHYKAHMLRKDGSRYLVQMDVVSVRDERGAVRYRVATQRDITEQYQAETALRASEEQYRALLESLDSVVSTVNYDGVFLYMSDVAARQLGGAAQDFIGKTMRELFPEQAALRQLETVRQVIREGKGVITEAQSVIQGQPRWYRTSIQPIHDEAGRVICALINATDIHDLKAAQQELLELNRTLEARVWQRTAEVQDLYDNAPTGYHSLDAHGNLIMVNQTELDWLGYTRDELVGRSIIEIITPASFATFQAAFPAFKQRGWLSDLELELIRKDGTLLPALINATAIYDDAGTYVMSRSTVFDNTERKKAEDALRLANVELERAVRAKDEFLANMSHELRTPLNAILGFGEILREQIHGPLNEGQQASLRNIDASGRHLLALINDILDLAKAEARRLDIQPERILVAEVCQASLLFVTEAAVKKELVLAFDLSDQTLTIEADPKRLKQILVNLLTNAVKFTLARGTVSLDAVADAEAGVVRFIVQDTGIGIAPDDLARLFQPFSQLDSSLSRQHEGTGLGLALVRRLTELHGGSITVESEVGTGSRFTIALPYRLPALVDAHPAAGPLAERTTGAELAPTALVGAPQAGPAPGEARLLLVDDNEANLAPMVDYLQARGYQVVVARNGLEALERAGEVCPDVILMDIQMPEMDGLEAIRRLRARPACAVTPIIALTALAMPGDRERCLAAGASAYLTKPVSLKGLVETMARLLHR